MVACGRAKWCVELDKTDAPSDETESPVELE